MAYFSDLTTCFTIFFSIVFPVIIVLSFSRIQLLCSSQEVKHKVLPFQTRRDFCIFTAQFVHPTIFGLSGQAQSNPCWLSAILLLPKDTEWVQGWVGKQCRSTARAVSDSLEFLVFRYNFGLYILFLIPFDIQDVNKTPFQFLSFFLT